MDISMGIGLLCLLGAVGGLIFVGWRSEGKSLRRQFEDPDAQPTKPDDIARRSQV